MTPGREMDALVAEKVMGWVWAQDNPAHYSTMFRPGQRYIVPPGVFDFSTSTIPADTTLPLAREWYGNVPRYSTDINAAWQVVSHMNADGWHVGVRAYRTAATCDVTCPRGPCVSHGNPHHDWHGVQGIEGKTVPEAICRAALQAVGAEPAP